uniref:Apple domain-containing protein n=1 Tax=Panagrolaimus superbus TaxID=310955 RepID=A0A914ZD04_9BILA
MTTLKNLLLNQSLLPQQLGIVNVTCIVTFQVFVDEDINAFKTTRIATVSNINECAYICYQNSCSGAIFVPADDKNEKAQCKVQMREEEKCHSKLQRHYTFNHAKAVVLSCFRCQPEKPITISPDAEITRATTTPMPELTKGRLTTIAPEKSETTSEKEGPVPPPSESSNKVEDTPKSAKPPAMAPTESGQVNSASNNNAAEEQSETAKSGDSGDKSTEEKPSEAEKTQEATTAKSEAETPAKSAEKEETSKPTEVTKAESATEKSTETEKDKASEKPEVSESATTPSSASSAPEGKTVSLGKNLN